MARVNMDEAAEQVKSLIQNAGGEMTRSDLDQALIAAGKPNIIQSLPYLKQAGHVKGRVSYVEGEIVHTYYIPEGGE